jgi:hypothetical protein
MVFGPSISAFVCKVLYIPKIAVPTKCIRLLDFLKKLCAVYIVCQILVFNAINTIVTNMEGNIFVIISNILTPVLNILNIGFQIPKVLSIVALVPM